MLNMDRSYTRLEITDSADRPVTLVTERLTLRIGKSWAGFGAAYERPWRVDHDGEITPIFDLVMITKLVGLLLVLVATITRTVRSD